MISPGATTTHRSAPADPPADPLAQAPLCAACPKLCRPACPVEQATGREALAPWRISATVRDALADGWTAEAAVVAGSCTGCGACADACLAGVVLPAESRAARAAAATAGVMLPGAAALAERIASTGSVRRRPDQVAVPHTSGAATAVLLGCTVQARRPAVGAAAVAVLRATGLEVRACGVPERCCGAAALDLGLADEARSLAASLAAELDGAAELVALSPGCVRMVRAEWPRLGLVAPPVRTSPEWLAGLLAEGRLNVARTAPTVAWHDPCTLARGLGVTDAPRAVLAALGADVREPAASGRLTRCAGGGAAYPVVDPTGAAKVAGVRAAELAGLGGTVASSCPQAEVSLGPEAVDLLELVAAALER